MSGFRVRTKSNRSKDRPLGCGGRIFLTVFFGFFAAMGGLILVFMGNLALEILDTHRWKKVECTIISSRVVRESGREDPYVLSVKYTYTVNGEEFTSEKLSTQNKRSSDHSKVNRLARKYKPDSTATCYVDPQNPSNAILERESLWFLLIGFVPLIFVAVGLGGIYFVWSSRRKTTADGKPVVEAISAKAPSKAGPVFMCIFFGVFFLVGGVLTFFFLVRPVVKILSARNWEETPCSVLSSEVTQHSGDDGPTYAIDILYSYEFNGRKYESNRYDFMGGSSSGYSGKRAIVKRYPPGKTAICYVNPNDPGEAVLEPGFTPTLLFGLIPMVFLFIGAGGLYYTIRRGRAKTAGTARPRWMPKPSTEPMSGSAASAIPAATVSTGPIVLKPKTSPVAKLIGMIIFSAFWNGIVSVFVVQAIQSWQRGKVQWGLTLFMIPFVLVGLGTVVGVVYFFLALFNPRPKLRVSAVTAPLGSSIDLEWEMSGSSRSIDRFQITLQGREEATYQRGTSTYTDKETFATINVADTKDFVEMARGRATVKIPPDTMHSFESDHNKIIWSLYVYGDIARWPDIKEEYPVVVAPMQHTQRG